MRILIVDDEQYICDQIAGVLYSMDLPPDSGIDSALDGLSALHLALNRIPDLLICDIRMPGLNGIELAEQILDLNRNCAIIILSHYSDPDYLRSAISLHVKAYLNKPVPPEKLRLTVTDVINEQNAISHQQEIYYDALANILDLLKKLWCLELFKQNPSYDDLIARCRQYHFSELIGAAWRCLFLRNVSSTRDLEYNLPPEVHMLTRSSLENGNAYCFLYASHEKYLSQQKTELFFLQISERHLCDGMATGDTVTDCHNAWQSYEQTKYAVDRLFYEDEPRLICGSSIKPLSAFIPTNSTLREMEKDLLAFDFQSAEKELSSLFERISEAPGAPVAEIVDYFQRMADMFLHVSEENQLSFHQSHVNTNLYRDILLADRFSSLRNRMVGWFRELIDFGEGDTRVIRSITACIRRNYTNPTFGNRDICAFTGYSVSYLCNLFKQNTGVTINYYITQVRMEHACQLLVNTDDSIESIAFAVGYSSAKHFIRSFKMHMMMPPGQYRKLHTVS